jgi:putative GTP pyrophosphokinase
MIMNRQGSSTGGFGMSAESFKQDYDHMMSVLGLLGPMLKSLAVDLLPDRLNVHSISYRLKTPDSARKKFLRVEGRYNSVADITDLLGLRIITYFPDEVDAAASTIEREFDIVYEHSIDKRALLDPDRFGYLSLHYVARVSRTRCQLPEYARFCDCRFEIQIRSILQHAWAEIEHDLGYKAPQTIPQLARRRFSRLAGLLEMADAEFVALKDELNSYRSGLITRLLDAPDQVQVDQQSIGLFINTDPTVAAVDKAIAHDRGSEIEDTSSRFAGRRSIELRGLGLRTIADVQEALEARRDIVRAFAAQWASVVHPSSIPSGISLSYLGYVLAAETESVERVASYLRTSRLALNFAPATVLEAYRAARDQVRSDLSP